MSINISGRSALIFAAGLWIGIAGPMRATETDAKTAAAPATASVSADKPIVLNKYARHRHGRKLAVKSRRSIKLAARPAKANAGEEPGGDSQSAIPAAVANANAQFPATEMPVETPQTLAARADDVLRGVGGKTDGEAVPADARLQLVSADQLNDVDRAIDDNKPSPEAAPATVDPQMAASRDGTALDQTSLIGKIFIAFGGLLTLASAVRMFIA